LRPFPGRRRCAHFTVATGKRVVKLGALAVLGGSNAAPEWQAGSYRWRSRE
jgi:hypothetical protein